MTTQYTITQAQAITLEQLDAMTLEQLQSVIDVLGTSEAKKARLKLDQVKAIIEKRKKEAKKAGAKEEQAVLQLVENSAKKVTRPRKPKADVVEPEKEADASEQTQEPEAKPEEKPKQPRKPKASASKDEKPEAKAPTLADMQKQFEAMQKQLKAMQAENEKLRAEKFPQEVETQKDGSKLVAINFKEVADVQKALVESPYKVYMQIHEGLDATATTFVVVFMNAEKLVLVDKSRQINSVLDLEVKHMSEHTVQIDKRDCPYQFYMMTTADKK